ncbi:ABC transporter substrate-binding protein [Variovorax boronicumulans]|uniref:ABC transporter substrate-binding protein n=2 Tax=Variovorax boronicumulans TaxID=436515 RepID=A0A250DMH4_9BURK|nr:ABC transporter substrate-binding protein [Variovorax boronicumulans]
MNRTLTQRHPGAPDRSPHLSRRSAMQLVTAGLAVWTAGAWAASAQSDAFPVRPIRMVIPFPPSGAADLVGRLYAKALAELSGQPVVPDNRPGASGLIGAQNVLASARDGYSLLIGSSSTLAVNAATAKSLPYDPLTDFVPVGVLATGPVVLVTGASSGIKSFEDLVQKAQAHPKTLNLGTGSTALQLQAEWLNETVGMKMTTIPYKGGSEVASALLANAVDVGMLDVSAAHALIRSGKLRGLALGASQPLASLPGVPTTAQLGVRGYTGESWIVAAVAAGTPDHVVDYYATVLAKAAKLRSTQDWLRERDLGYVYRTAAQTKALIAADIALYKQLVDRLGIPKV